MSNETIVNAPLKLRWSQLQASVTGSLSSPASTNGRFGWRIEPPSEERIESSDIYAGPVPKGEITIVTRI